MRLHGLMSLDERAYLLRFTQIWSDLLGLNALMNLDSGQSKKTHA
jgi:hypothetical protein